MLLALYDGEIARFEGELRRLLGAHPGYRAIQVIPGVGPVIAAVQRQPVATKLGSDLARIGARRGKNIAKVAAARKLLALVYYALRDGEVRCLRAMEAA